MEGIARGVHGFFAAFGFMRRHGMGWLFAVPLVLQLLLVFGLYALLQGPADRLGLWLADRLMLPVDPMADEGWRGTWSTVKRLVNDARALFTFIALKIAIAYLLFTLNKYVVLVLLSPLMAYASEHAEEVITGRGFPFSLARLLRDALRGSLLALRNAIIELLLHAGIWLVTLLLPFMVPISVVVLFLVSAYFYGFSMFDYVHERHGHGIGASTRAMHRELGAVVANGACFSLLMKVPLLGLLLAPGMGAVGAVLAMHGAGRLGTTPGILR